MAWIVKKGDNYYVYQRVGGKVNCVVAGPFKERAKKIKRDWEDTKAGTQNNHADYHATLWSFCDRYFELPKPRQPSTLRIIKDTIFKIKSFFDEKVKIIDINDDRIEAFIKHLLKTYNHTTVHMDMRNLRGILNMAVKKRILDENPCAAPIKMLGQPKGREIYLTDKEKARLYASAMRIKFKRHADNIEMVNIIRVFLGTGVRLAELLNMAREHMVSDCEIIIPSRSNEAQGHLNPTKSHDAYKLPLNREIMPIFHAVRSGRIFEHWTIDHLSHAFRKVADGAKLPELTPHGLRHTFASDFLKKGGKIEELQEMLNHASIETTRKYSHFEKGRLKERVDAMVEPQKWAVI